MTANPKHAFITGASSGFGALISVELALRGWRVTASMRDLSKAHHLLDLAKASDLQTESINVVDLDVTDPVSRAETVDRLLTAGDVPDLVLHCAGYTTAAFFEDMPFDKVRHLFETNFFGAADLTQRLLPALRARGSGTVAVITSNAVNTAHPMYSIYAATKWALEGWAEALDIELAPFGVDVRIVQPGNHDTAFGSNVEVLIDPDSAYASLGSVAMVRMERLGGRARPAERGALDICDALESDSGRLRTRIGGDDKLMAALARWAPYSVRRKLVRKITGIEATALVQPR
ncbi:SDR family NAD(P)-dependent oxidoreductase [Gordonia rubripertincta]|uniref:SDR family NAD(P)-dependent oxidoreductase n=1 Tax=Gordonia rubripertincta TaxID=36822 RepID=A0ABT4MS83_GORRU|nr:SDR family NAD(P)-dependent oxidoreductase [Gordonia rubripertincta]MCZ4548587.1 SDR family NAD(P)-dependent oxidoreductase [Gordonia rubripertincta]